MDKLKVFFNLVGDLPLDGEIDYRYQHELYHFCRKTKDYDLWYFLYKMHLGLTTGQIITLVDWGKAKGIDFSDIL